MPFICPFCYSDTELAFVAETMGKYLARYMTCTSCGSLAIEDPHWLTEAYADPMGSDRLDTGAEWRNGILARAVQQIGRLAPSGPWLDYGCGQGLLISRLRQQGHSIHGYDPYRDPFTLDPTDSYAMVMSFEVLEHQTIPHQLFQRLHQKMKPGAILLLSTALWERSYGQHWEYLALASGQHVAFPSADGMSALAKQSGLHWWATGILRENSQLQLHVFSEQKPNHAIVSILEACQFSVRS